MTSGPLIMEELKRNLQSISDTVKLNVASYSTIAHLFLFGISLFQILAEIYRPKVKDGFCGLNMSHSSIAILPFLIRSNIYSWKSVIKKRRNHNKNSAGLFIPSSSTLLCHNGGWIQRLPLGSSHVVSLTSTREAAEDVRHVIYLHYRTQRHIPLLRRPESD